MPLMNNISGALNILHFPKKHDYGFFARNVSNMGYWPGGETMASLPPVSTHMQKTVILMLCI